MQTYLPDGDIDLTSFGVLNVEEALAESVYAVLQDVEHSMKSRYVVKDVQLIRAEVSFYPYSLLFIFRCFMIYSIFIRGMSIVMFVCQY